MDFLIELINIIKLSDYLIRVLNNTFLGTLLAGGILALFGLFLYRRQKEIDIGYEECKKIKDLSCQLFANIDIAAKEFRGQIGIYNGKNPQIKLLSETLNSKFNNYFNKDLEQRFNQYVREIERSLNSLVVQLKVQGKSSYKNILGVLIEKIAMLNMYFLATSALSRFSVSELNDSEKNFEEKLILVNSALQNLINQKL